MIELKYSLVIEATEDPSFFGFYSPELEGFTCDHHGGLFRLALRDYFSNRLEPGLKELS